MGKGDIDPSFTFFVSTTSASPWELAGALKDAETPTGTSVDEKIRKRLAAGGRHSHNTAAPTAPRNSKRARHEEEEEEEDSEDEPLPGEVGEKDVEEDGDVAEENDEDDDDDATTDSDDDTEDDAPSHAPATPDKHNPKQAATPNPKQQDRKTKTKDSSGANGTAHNTPSTTKTATTTTTPTSTTKKAANGPSGGFFAATPDGTRFEAGSFAELQLSRPLLKACDALGYTHPTPIQAACIPLALAGRDICGSAMTGSGKTAAFALPFLERLLHRTRRVVATYVLVLTPTRELAVQVHSMVQKLSQFTDIRSVLVVGGLSLAAQAAALRSQPEVVVATPGRLIDHVRNSASVGLEDLQVLVLDEADRLLEMGFADEISEIVKMAPVKRQTLLFSATMTDQVKKLVNMSLRQPVRLAAHATAAAPEKLRHEVVRLKGAAASHKEAVLLTLASRSFSTGRTIVFFKTKQRAHRAKILFGLAGLPAAAELHGDMSQAARLESLERFRKGEVAFLLCTDVAARGLDILGVETVLNYDAPTTLTSYLHRVGRTARAGSKGLAVTCVEDGDRQLVKQVIKTAKITLLARVPPNAAVRAWADRIESMEADVSRIRSEEAEERAIRKAEMQATKAANMIEHEEEIKARPARTWFVSEAKKRAVKEASRLEALGELPGADEGVDGENGGGEDDKRNKKKEKEAKRAKRKLEAEQEAEKKKKKTNVLEEETAVHNKGIRSAKALEQELRQQGLRPAEARKMAQRQLSTVSKNSINASNRQKKAAKKAKPSDSLFEGDGIDAPAPRDSRVYAGGAKSGALKIPNTKLNKRELARAKRGGRGKHSFKSKARHKRRK